MYYSGLKHKDSIDVVRLYAMASHPAISHFNGFYTQSNGVRIIINNYKYSLNKCIQILKRRPASLLLNLTEKYIISYGLACALEFLHNREVYNELSPEHVFWIRNFIHIY